MGDLAAIERLHREIVERHRQRHVVVELHQLLRHARILGMIDQRLPALRLLDLGRMQQHGFEIAIRADQLGRGLRPDAGHARHIVDAVADQRLNLDHLLRTDAEFLHHLGRADRLLLDRIPHRDARRDELHQILVGRDDRDRGAGSFGFARIGRDQIVGLEILALDAADIEGIGRVAHELELRE